MQKRLLAAAVAGALAAPAIALAQSTVQIYGTAEVEWGYLDQGSGRPNTDYMESTGSYLGFRGTEALGGGISAWFQCETTMDIRAFDQVGLCSRNSGLGFRGGFGNVWLGRWHTPMSRALSVADTGGEATGNLGISYLAAGGSGSTSIIGTAASPNGGASPARYRFRRRETCLGTYETPSFSGFMVGAAVSCGNAASEGAANALDGNSNNKPRVYSIAGTYTNGPLFLGVSYEKHVDVGVSANNTADLDDDAWGLSGSYTFGSVKVGGIYLERKFEAIGGELKKKSAAIGLEWNIAGPHSLHLNYNWLDDTEGDCKATTAALLVTNCSLSPTTAGGIATIGGDSGAQSYSIAYQYDFSKRTTAKIGYVRMENDDRSQAARLGTAATVLTPGDNQDVFALVLKHRF